MTSKPRDTHLPAPGDLEAAQARVLIEQSLFAICIVQDGLIRFANKGLAVIFGFDAPAAMVDGVALLDLVAPEDRAMVDECLRRHGMGERGDLHYSFSGRRCDGSLLKVEARGRDVDFAGRPAIILLLVDVTERFRYEAELERRAAGDSLTGLPNRILLFDRLQQSIVHSRRKDELFAFLCLDINGFKEINDICGQTGGDQVLRIVAERLTGALRASDTLARLGGDQFAVIASGLMFGDDVVPVVEKLREALASPIAFAGHELSLTASIGVSLFPATAEDANGLYRAAEAAMLASRQQVRGGYLVATADGVVSGDSASS